MVKATIIKKTFSILGFMLVCISSLQAQLITTQQPVAMFVGIEDLWSISITTPPNGQLTNAVITLEVVDDQGQVVVTSKSTQFTLSSGVVNYNKFSMGPLTPLQNTLSMQPKYSTIAQNGILPAGNYHASYTLGGYNQQNIYMVFPSTDVSFTVEMLFPPSLLTPFDNDTIDTRNPIFAWAPAFTNGQRISYDIEVAEQLPGQSPEQSLNANPAYYRQENLLTTSVTYPYAAKQLKTNQWYAWRVIAKIGDIPASRTESWRFIIKEPIDTPCIPQPVEYYFQLQEKVTGSYASVNNGQLDFYFSEKYKVTKTDLIFRIFNIKGKIVASNKSIPRVYATGTNYYTLMLTQNDASLPKGYYTMEVDCEKGLKLLLRFELKNDVTPCIHE